MAISEQTRHRLLASAAFLTLTWFAPLDLGGQESPRDRLRGRVLGPDSAGLAGASVSVVPIASGPSVAARVASTDSAGNWFMLVEGRATGYALTVKAVGMTPVTVTTQRTNDSDLFTVTVRLARAVVVLDAVRVVESRRPRSPRELAPRDVAASETGTGFFVGLAADDRGSIAAMAATVPGVSLLSDASGGAPAFSVMGLSANQSNVTLNGMQFSGGDIPRDAVTVTRVAATSYDVSRGGFSGGQLSIVPNRAGNLAEQSTRLTVDSRSMQRGDPISRQLGHEYENLQLSGSLTGPVVLDRLFYNVAFQVGRRSSDLQSLIAGDAFALQRVGVARDSATRLMSVLSQQGIPLTSSGVPVDRQTDNASLLTRFDWSPSPLFLGSMIVSARRNRADGGFLGATALPAHGGETDNWGADVTLAASMYNRGNILSDVRLAVRRSVATSNPYLELPDARVLVASEFADGTSGITWLQFGGNAALPRMSSTSGVELFDQTTWLSIDGRHRFKATFNLRGDSFEQDQAGNRRGTFVFNSIDDIATNQPASFTRTFGTGSVGGSANTGSISLGDLWRRTDRLLLQYGVRVDGNRFGGAPPYNPQVDSLLHARTDYAPREIHLSPRFGFNWAFGNNGIRGVPGFGGPRGTVRGGIGEFRNDVPATLIAPGLTLTGLPSGERRLQCIGSNVPQPDWNAFGADPGSIPAACADGAQASPFATTAPNVWLVGPGYAAQRSWRANLGLFGPFITKMLRFGVEGIHSLNLHQQSALDLNFRAQPRFTLPVEGNRPVFADLASIVPASGAVSNWDSRAASRFGSVTALQSDLRSSSSLLTFSVLPVTISSTSLLWTATYTLQRYREQSRGFGGGSTSGNPLEVSWGRSPLDTRHQFNATLYFRLRDWISANVSGRLASGTPFTPMINGDVNADGLSNDRAFIFGGVGGDSAVRHGMQALMASAPSRIRDCLGRQTGRVADRNSCEGPWTGTMNINVLLNPRKLGWNNRATVSLSLANPLAGVDELLHGSANMHGWGQPIAPDGSLLLVRGFDPASSTYRYHVNSRFGDTRLSQTGMRAPFRVTLDVKVLFSQDYDHQRTTQALARGRTRTGARLTARELQVRFMSDNYDPLTSILASRDSLSMLDRAQVERLTVLQKRVRAEQDSVWAATGAYLTALPVTYDLEEAVRRTRVAMIAVYEYMIIAMREVSRILTPEQIAGFPPALRASFHEQTLREMGPSFGFTPRY